MDIGKWITTGLLMAFVVLSGGELDEGGETSVWVGVNVDGEDYHACAVYTQPKHTPQDLRCEAPETPVNGGYEITTVSDVDTNNTRHIIRYHCDAGYDLVGQANRTCNGTSKRWTTHEPHCEPKYIHQLKQQWETLQSKVADIDSKITAMDAKWLRTAFLMSEFDSFKEQLSKDGQLATVGFKNGSVVSQFTWMVANIEEAITKAKGDEHYHIESKPFYTNVPGYRVQLRLFPSDSNSGYVGVYLRLVKGEFDNDLSWPFSYRYEFVSVSRDGNRIAYILINPPIEKACSIAFLQPPNNKELCGEIQYIKIDTLLSNKDVYLIDGSLSIKVTFILSK